MLRKLILVLSALLLLVVLLGCTDRGTDYELTTVALPRGEATEGRQHFVTLGCTACHRVGWDVELPQPVSASKGPDLGRLGAPHTASWLATSIIAPSHQISPEFREVVAEGNSPMGDFTRAMTVRELADLVAYLRAGDVERAAISRTARIHP